MTEPSAACGAWSRPARRDAESARAGPARRAAAPGAAEHRRRTSRRRGARCESWSSTPRRRGVALGLESRLHYHEIPHPDEALDLLADYDNASAGYWHDVGHCEVQARLGMIDRAAWFPTLTARTIGSHLHDVDGIARPPRARQRRRRLVLHRRRPAAHRPARLRDRPAPAGRQGRRPRSRSSRREASSASEKLPDAHCLEAPPYPPPRVRSRGSPA